MWWRISNFIFVISIALWLLAMAIYLRGKFRADVVTIITPWHHCMAIASVNDGISVTDLSPWPKPRRFQWTTGPTKYKFSPDRSDSLLGPEIEGLEPGSRLKWLWAGFGFEKGYSWIYRANNDYSIDYPWRDNVYISGRPWLMVRLKYCQVGVPVWFVPVFFGIVPLVWTARIARRRLRRRSRRRRGLCVQCGYDLRASLARCPECGLDSA